MNATPIALDFNANRFPLPVMASTNRPPSPIPQPLSSMEQPSLVSDLADEVLHLWAEWLSDVADKVEHVKPNPTSCVLRFYELCIQGLVVKLHQPVPTPFDYFGLLDIEIARIVDPAIADSLLLIADWLHVTMVGKLDTQMVHTMLVHLLVRKVDWSLAVTPRHSHYASRRLASVLGARTR